MTGELSDFQETVIRPILQSKYIRGRVDVTNATIGTAIVVAS